MSVLAKAKKVDKDWGYEIWMANNEKENYCGKILYIKFGHSTSMHFHQKKHGEVFVLDRLMPHRLVPKGGDVKFVEISTFHEDSDSYRVYRELPEQLSIT